MSTSGVPIIDENDKLVGYRGVDADITENKQNEEELKRQTEEKSKYAQSLTQDIEKQLKEILNQCSLLKMENNLIYVEKVENQINTILKQLEA